MGLGFKPAFDKEIIRGAMSIAVERSKKRVANFLIEAGKSFLAYAESNKGYNNVTFGLISSTGFLVLIDGDIVHEEFSEGGNNDGKQQGLKVAKDNAPEEGVVLIGVAGMDYALYVESKSKDVISGSSQQTEIMLKRALRK